MPTIVIKRRKDGRIITLSFALIIVFLWILIGYNTNSSDSIYYQSLFSRAAAGITYHAVESGFWWLIKLSVKIGISYELFLKIYTAISLILIGSTVIRYTNRPSMVLYAYFCYPFLLDIAQIRHFMACALFIYAVRYLEVFSVKNLLKYCLLIILATTQQIIAFAYFIFLLVYLTNQLTAKRIAISLTISAFFGYRLLYKMPFINKILGLRNTKINYSSGISITQFLLYCSFFLLLLGMCLYLNRIGSNVITNLAPHKNTILYDDKFLFKICIYSSIFIPIILLDFQFTRLFRGCLVLIYIYITNNIKFLGKKRRIIMNVIFFLTMMMVWIKLFGPGSGYYEILTKPIFNDNGFLNTLF